MNKNDVPLTAIYEMRDFIDVCQDYTDMFSPDDLVSESGETMLCEEILAGQGVHPIFGDLEDAIDTMRAFMESSGGDYALGFEEGMQRAAGIVEMILKRHKEK